MAFNLTADEKTELCQSFDLKQNGRFHYLEFMKWYSQKPETVDTSNSSVYNKHTHTLSKRLMTEHKTLRRAFSKLDHSKNGYLSVADFRRALKSCRFEVSDEDFYHIMTEFDHDLTGKISYDSFLQAFVDQ